MKFPPEEILILFPALRLLLRVTNEPDPTSLFRVRLLRLVPEKLELRLTPAFIPKDVAERLVALVEPFMVTPPVPPLRISVGALRLDVVCRFIKVIKFRVRLVAADIFPPFRAVIVPNPLTVVVAGRIILPLAQIFRKLGLSVKLLNVDAFRAEFKLRYDEDELELA